MSNDNKIRAVQDTAGETMALGSQGEPVAMAEQLPTLDSLLPELLQPAWEFMSGYPLAAASATVLVFFMMALLLRFVVFRLLQGAAGLTNSAADDQILQILRKPLFNTVFLFGVTLAIALAELPWGEKFLIHAVLSFIVMSWLLASLKLTTIMLEAFSSDHRFKVIESRTVPLFDLTGKLLMILVGSYILLMIWGINPVGWLASAGIMGIAVGFAAKDTLGNLFSGFFIVADAPYKINDYITLDTGERGKVVAIGLRSTRLMTRGDVEITIPNGVIGAAKIVNESGGPSSSMRIGVPVGVAYGSDVDAVCELLTSVGEAHTETRSNPEPRIRMRAFGASSLDFELLCWIDKPEDKGRITHELLMGIYKTLGEHNIEIPYAKRDIYIKEMPHT
ncbi:mechanosensitive ion channel family protein [Pseudomonadales bacterium]|nr:mechanosensitive ion channel family protein [Pseudomonadales bacterium]